MKRKSERFVYFVSGAKFQCPLSFLMSGVGVIKTNIIPNGKGTLRYNVINTLSLSFYHGSLQNKIFSKELLIFKIIYKLSTHVPIYLKFNFDFKLIFLTYPIF